MSFRNNLTTGLPIRFSSNSGRTRMNREALQQLARDLTTASLSWIEDPVLYAGTLPWFRTRGLYTVKDVIDQKKTVIFESLAGWPAVERFFRLSPVQARLLLAPKYSVGKTNKQVAEELLRCLGKLRG